MRNHRIGVTGKGQDVTLQRPLYLLQDDARRFRRRPEPDSSHSILMAFIGQGIYVVRRFLIGMDLQDRRQKGRQLRLRYDRLDPFFPYRFHRADGADKGIGAGPRLKPPVALHRKGAVAVISRISRAGCRHGLPDGFAVAFGYIDGHLVQRFLHSRYEARDLPQSQPPGQHVVHPAVGAVQVGVRAVHGNMMGQQLLIHVSVVRIAAQGLDAAENDGMVADDEIDAVRYGIVDAVPHDVQRDHDLLYRFVRAAYEQPWIIPGLLQR